jgi:serine/threonine protein kinase
MGTANYMAPEQRKDAKRADHKADIYSFGVMTYELLTGELPVGKFPSPSTLVAGLDPRWDALIERCLAPDPAERPESAADLAHALELLAGMEPRPKITPKKVEPKSRMLSWLGFGTAVAVTLGVVSLRVAQDHGLSEKRPQPAAARAAPVKKPLRR